MNDIQLSFSADPIAWAVALTAVLATILITFKGWTRDQAARDNSQRAECLQNLVDLTQARIEPLFNTAWTQQDAIAANKPHMGAIVAMQAVSAKHQELRLVRHIADQTFVMQEEAIRYGRSVEAQMDTIKGRMGYRRAAITQAVAWMQEELLLWQRGEITRRQVHSFWWHYCDALLKPSTVPDDSDEWYEMKRTLGSR